MPHNTVLDTIIFVKCKLIYHLNLAHLVAVGPSLLAVIKSFFITWHKQANVQPLLIEYNLDPLLPLRYRLISKLLFL